MEPEREPRRVSESVLEVVAEGDVPMGSVEARLESGKG